MEEDFLQYLDEKYMEKKNRAGIRNTDYIMYFALQPVAVDVREQFKIAKSRKSRILVAHGKIFVDLTDYDIISIISGLGEDTVNQLLRELSAGYEGRWSSYKFRIADVEYEGKGIDYSTFNVAMPVTLDADFCISLGELLFVINMILYKDIMGQKYVKEEDTLLLIERTIIKYISLILYYKYNNNEAENYLNTIQYPLYKKDDLLKVKQKVSKYDKRFTKKGFDKLKNIC